MSKPKILMFYCNKNTTPAKLPITYQIMTQMINLWYFIYVTTPTYSTNSNFVYYKKLKSSSTGSSFPAILTKTVPLVVVSLECKKRQQN